MLLILALAFSRMLVLFFVLVRIRSNIIKLLNYTYHQLLLEAFHIGMVHLQLYHLFDIVLATSCVTVECCSLTQ